MKRFHASSGFFPEVIGNDAAKLALILNLIEPRCGGVLIVGQKGTGKSSLLRCLRRLLDTAGWPYVEIPLGVTEDSLLGSIDVERSLKGGAAVYEPGLLERAKGGFVLIDDINLLPDEYLCLILQMSESFSLVATSNPEEGFLSPHFLDRFGMCVKTQTLTKPERADLLKHAAVLGNKEGMWSEHYSELLSRIKRSRAEKDRVSFDGYFLQKCTEVTLKRGIRSHRAEVFLFYASLAFAALKGDQRLNEDHLEKVVPLVLSHRTTETQGELHPHHIERRQSPKDHPRPAQGTGDPDRRKRAPIEQGESSHQTPHKETERPLDSSWELVPTTKEEVFVIGEVFAVRRFSLRRDRTVRQAVGRRTKSRTANRGGRFLRSVIFDKGKEIDLFGTLKAAAPFQILRNRRDKLVIYPEDIRYKSRERKTGHLVVFLVDASGSMGAQRRMEAVKGAVVSLLMDCYQKRDKVSVVIFRKDYAEVVLPPTSSVELAHKRLKDLPTGGKTPLPLGLLETYKLIKNFHLKCPRMRILLICLSDGRANVPIKPGEDPLEEAKRIASEISNLTYVDSIIIDCEPKESLTRLDLSKELAQWLKGRFLDLEDLKAKPLTDLVVGLKTP